MRHLITILFAIISLEGQLHAEVKPLGRRIQKTVVRRTRGNHPL